jgi:hypothetical protein
VEEVLAYVASFVFWTASVFFVVWNDERNLTEEEGARAWPKASRLSAIVGFGPLCIPVHFWRTRRSFFGICIGFSYVIDLVGLSWLLGELIEFVYTR